MTVGEFKSIGFNAPLNELNLKKRSIEKFNKHGFFNVVPLRFLFRLLKKDYAGNIPEIRCCFINILKKIQIPRKVGELCFDKISTDEGIGEFDGFLSESGQIDTFISNCFSDEEEYEWLRNEPISYGHWTRNLDRTAIEFILTAMELPECFTLLLNIRGVFEDGSCIKVTPAGSNAPEKVNPVKLLREAAKKNERETRAVIERLKDHRLPDEQQMSLDTEFVHSLILSMNLGTIFECYRQNCNYKIRPLVIQFIDEDFRDKFIKLFRSAACKLEWYNELEIKPRCRRDHTEKDLEILKQSRKLAYEENKKAGVFMFYVDGITVKRRTFYGPWVSK